jgi:hypothetical protein
LLRKLGEGEADSAELTEVGVGRRGGGVVSTTERVVVVRARLARPSERGEEAMTMGTSCGGGGRGVAPFYRVGEVADWVVLAAVVHFQGGGRLRKGRRRGGGAG